MMESLRLEPTGKRLARIEQQLKGIAGLNVLRVMRKVEAVAARLQKEKPPSDARIAEVDKP